MGKGGTLGSFVMCNFPNGTSKTYPSKEQESQKINKKSPVVYVKEPVAKFFNFKEMTISEVRDLSKRTVQTIINGKKETIETMVRVGSTGASRSVTVRFTALQTIGKKSVASVNIAMPTSYTFGDMVKLLSENKERGAVIAQIVSPDGRAVTFRTPYKADKNKPKLR